MARRRNSRPLVPRPSVPDPRRHLLEAVLAFVRAARSTPGALRIALLGSLTTDKPIPKDADVLVTIDAATDLGPLARLGRRLLGTAQTINLGADIFLADAAGRYLGRICHYRECFPRVRPPGAQLRPAAAPERRPPDRDPEPHARRRPAHRAMAARCRALHRAGGHAGASARTAGRGTSHDLSPSKRRTSYEADFQGKPPSRCSAEIGGDPDAICSCRALPFVTLSDSLHGAGPVARAGDLREVPGLVKASPPAQIACRSKGLCTGKSARGHIKD